MCVCVYIYIYSMQLPQISARMQAPFASKGDLGQATRNIAWTFIIIVGEAKSEWISFVGTCVNMARSWTKPLAIPRMSNKLSVSQAASEAWSLMWHKWFGSSSALWWPTAWETNARRPKPDHVFLLWTVLCIASWRGVHAAKSLIKLRSLIRVRRCLN